MGYHEPCARCREAEAINYFFFIWCEPNEVEYNAVINWNGFQYLLNEAEFKKNCFRRDELLISPCTCSNHPSGVSFEYRPVRRGGPSEIGDNSYTGVWASYKKRYVDYMVDQSELDQEEAEEVFDNGYTSRKDMMFNLDVFDPEDAVLSEMSYWDD